MRLIDADELKEQCHTIPDPKGIYCGLDIIEKYEIDDAPTVDVLEQIRAEIDGIEINGRIDEHTMFIRTGEQVKQIALEIIDKYTMGDKE